MIPHPVWPDREDSPWCGGAVWRAPYGGLLTVVLAGSMPVQSGPDVYTHFILVSDPTQCGGMCQSDEIGRWMWTQEYLRKKFETEKWVHVGYAHTMYQLLPEADSGQGGAGGAASPPASASP